ncbi:acyl-CoA dehydrogenase, partial [Candidatus Sumerlaeota bacterium]|nr:acyl-CoA dehydrogenase [Candidatus Sumerlaeota bacterium]
MDFDYSPKVKDLIKRLTKFMNDNVYDAEKVAEQQVHDSGDEHHMPQIIKDLQQKARGEGLWNLFM